MQQLRVRRPLHPGSGTDTSSDHVQGWIGNRAYRAFSRWADALKGPTEFFFFAKVHHEGTTSNQWPVGLSPVLTV